LKTPLASALFNNLLTEIILFNGFIEMAAYTTLEHNSSNTTSRIGYLVLPDYKWFTYWNILIQYFRYPIFEKKQRQSVI
jgi:hypothetical protein